MMKAKCELTFVSLFYMPAPAFLVHISRTFGAVINVSSCFSATDRAFQDSLPPPSFPLSPLESVT